MVKTVFVCAVLLAVATGGVFAQPTNTGTDDSRFPANTITVDAVPIMTGIYYGVITQVMSVDYFDVIGFGIGLQYERQLLPEISVAGRFAYWGLNIFGSGISVGINSISLEAHGRYYPFKGAYFLDLMLGYANLKNSISINSEDSLSINLSALGISSYSDTENKTINGSFVWHSLKLGAKTGWRIDAGKSGGFVFEPSLGWVFAIDMEQYPYIEGFGDFRKYYILGGPRLGLNFGVRF